ncbi:MAG TPA: nucleotidyltransferase family protein [Acidobacteriaceae bacterium]|jgi:molybdenum cofactor cytidylyltransferase|nr:nucleotidyltransferase family protein [Acidobacteriaceae bacterium]
MPDFCCAAVVLAAGASTRLGQPKQLLLIDGESLLRRTARMAVEAGCAPVCVVLGFHAQRMQPELTGLAVQDVVNQTWQEGMGSSLRAGMNAVLQAVPQPDSVVVLVCDQARLTTSHLRQLLERHTATENPGITASVYGDKAGVPAVFPARLFPALLASQGDRGARDLIRAHSTEVQGIPWPEGVVDIDRPEDVHHN